MDGSEIKVMFGSREVGRIFESSKEALQKPPLPSRMEQKCSVRLFLTTPECAVFCQYNSKNTNMMTFTI